MHFSCRTCATQFAESSKPPERCPICEDERQYVGLDGQQWTTLELPAAEVQRIAAALDAISFERILGAWWDRVVPCDGNEVVRRSAARYAAALAK